MQRIVRKKGLQAIIKDLYKLKKKNPDKFNIVFRLLERLNGNISRGRAIVATFDSKEIILNWGGDDNAAQLWIWTRRFLSEYAVNPIFERAAIPNALLTAQNRAQNDTKKKTIYELLRDENNAFWLTQLLNGYHLYEHQQTHQRAR